MKRNAKNQNAVSHPKTTLHHYFSKARCDDGDDEVTFVKEVKLPQTLAMQDSGGTSTNCGPLRSTRRMKNGDDYTPPRRLRDVRKRLNQKLACQVNAEPIHSSDKKSPCSPLNGEGAIIPQLSLKMLDSQEYYSDHELEGSEDLAAQVEQVDFVLYVYDLHAPCVHNCALGQLCF